MYICKRGHLWPKLCKDLDINMRCTSKSLQYKTQHNDTKSDHEGNFIISCGNDEESDEGIAEYITLQAKPGLLNT